MKKIKEYLPVVGCLVIVSIFALLFFGNRALLEQKKAWELEEVRLKREVATITAEAEKLRLEAYKNFQALQEREKTLTALTNQTEALRQEFEEIYANNEPCQAWADTPLPEPVLKWLRK